MSAMHRGWWAAMFVTVLATVPALAQNWSISLAVPNAAAAVGATAIYAGTITNTSGAPLELSGGLSFTSSPELEQFDVDFSDELLALDLVIPTTGYTGPIFKVRWLANAAPGSFGAGAITLSAGVPAAPPTLAAAFSLGSPGAGPFCTSGTGQPGATTSVAFDDSTGRPSIAFNNVLDGTLSYANFTGASWNTSRIASGIGVAAAPSLALDRDLHPHVAYYDASVGNLKHAWHNGAVWINETVESAGDVGGEPSLTIDAAGDLHVSYWDATNGDLHYARRSGSVWTVSVVDTVGNVGRYSSIVADENQVPYISYFDATARDLKFARRSGTGWLTEIVDSAGTTGTWGCLRRHGNTFALSYRVATPGARAIRLATGTPGNWVSELVDNVGNPGVGTSLQLNGFGQPRIAYVDSLNRKVRYASKTGASWELKEASSNGRVGVSLALDNAEQPLISYTHGLTGEVLFSLVEDCATTDVEAVPAGAPTLITLEGTRPNPFRHSTTFAFTLARAADVRLRVYDTAGRLVAEPFAGPVSAGHHDVNWDGTGRNGARLAPGRYLYEVRGLGEARAGKLVRLR